MTAAIAPHEKHAVPGVQSIAPNTRQNPKEEDKNESCRADDPAGGHDALYSITVTQRTRL
jgi:hypothetical protein